MADMVNVQKKARVLVTASYSNGVPLYQERAFVADTRVLQCPIKAFKAVELTIVMGATEAEEFADALRLGETEICIESIPPRTAR
jgi:hypothetical protein